MDKVNYSSLKDYYETFKNCLSDSDFEVEDNEISEEDMEIESIDAEPIEEENSSKHPKLEEIDDFEFIAVSSNHSNSGLSRSPSVISISSTSSSDFGLKAKPTNYKRNLRNQRKKNNNKVRKTESDDSSGRSQFKSHFSVSQRGRLRKVKTEQLLE